MDIYKNNDAQSKIPLLRQLSISSAVSRQSSSLNSDPSSIVEALQLVIQRLDQVETAKDDRVRKPLRNLALMVRRQQLRSLSHEKRNQQIGFVVMEAMRALGYTEYLDISCIKNIQIALRLTASSDCCDSMLACLYDAMHIQRFGIRHHGRYNLCWKQCKELAGPIMHIQCVGASKHGKSAIAGRLVHAFSACSMQSMATLKRICKDQDTSSCTWTMHRHLHEKHQNRTRSTSYWPLHVKSTESKTAECILIDSPGTCARSTIRHVWRHLIPGNDSLVALLVISAADNEFEDTWRFTRRAVLEAICLCQARHVVVVINKMNQVKWSESRFYFIVGIIQQLLENQPAIQSSFLPLDALENVGITTSCDQYVRYWSKPPMQFSLVKILFTLHQDYSKPSFSNSNLNPNLNTSKEILPRFIITRRVQQNKSQCLLVGHLLHGTIKRNDELQIVDHAYVTKNTSRHMINVKTLRVKSIEVFNKPVSYVSASTKARIGILLSQVKEEPRIALLTACAFKLKAFKFTGKDWNAAVTYNNANVILRFMYPPPKNLNFIQFNLVVAENQHRSWPLYIEALRHEPKAGHLCYYAKLKDMGHRGMMVVNQEFLLIRQNDGTRVAARGVFMPAESKQDFSSLALHVNLPLPRVESLLNAMPSAIDAKVKVQSRVPADVAAKKKEVELKHIKASIRATKALLSKLELSYAQLSAAPSSSNLRKCFQCFKQAECDVQSSSDIPICRRCCRLNKVRREQLLDYSKLEGVVVVTGARIKLGYATVERLIKGGAKHLVLTTRFPHLLAAQLQSYVKNSISSVEPEWIHIYGCDFRSVTAVNALGKHLSTYYSSVACLINNAAQTVRRSVSFYSSLVQKELELAKQAASLSVVAVKFFGKSPFQQYSQQDSVIDFDLSALSLSALQNHPCASALSTQVKLLNEDWAELPCDLQEAQQHFPQLEQQDEQTGEAIADLRWHNSWTRGLASGEGEIESIECLEVLLINTLAPFMLLKNLVPNLRVASGTVINVTSREGSLARVKFAEHPQTNMCKAALNMLTRTSSIDLWKECRVIVVAVDPGWVTRMQPMNPSGKQAPLSLEDGAARVLDPLVQRMSGIGPKPGAIYRHFQAMADNEAA